MPELKAFMGPAPAEAAARKRRMSGEELLSLARRWHARLSPKP